MALFELDRARARRVLSLAGPVVLALLTQTSINIVDTFFLKDMPEAQAALTPALMLLWATGGFLAAISVGTLAITARRFGEALGGIDPDDRAAEALPSADVGHGGGEHVPAGVLPEHIDDPAVARRYHRAGAVLPNSLLITVVGGLLFTAVGWIFMRQMFGAIVASPRVIELGTVYTRWRFIGIISLAATGAYKAFFDSIGKTQMHLYSSIVASILNAVLCWLLIFGNLGFPRMGIEGAGIAAAVASWVGLFVMIGISLLRRYNGVFRPYRARNLSGTTVWSLLRLSVPGGIATVVVMSGFLIFTKIVARLDAGHAVAANGAATTIIIEVLSITFFACMAFGTATATLVGQSLGARDPDGAAKYAWTSVKVGVMIFGAIGVLLLVFAPQVMHVFSRSGPVIEAGTMPMRVVSTMGPIVAVGMILTQALFGAGDTRYVMIVEMTLHFGVLVPVSWIFGLTLGLGLVGIWGAVVLYMLLLATTMFVRFARGKWKHLQI